MEGGDYAVQPWGTADLLQEDEESTSADQFEGHCQVNEGDVQSLQLLPALLPQLA